MVYTVPDLKKAELYNLIARSKLPVLIDFFRDGCVPCKMLEKTIEEIADEYKGRISVCRINLTDKLEIAETFDIKSVPTLLIMLQGRVKGKITGLHSKSEISRIIASVS